MATTTRHHRPKGPKDLTPHLPRRIAQVFDLMVVAEEEITAAKARHPGAAAQIHAAFRLLRPPSAFAGLDDCVYCHHARELLRRVAAGEDTAPGTVAECMVVLSNQSLRAPLEAGHQVLFERLFGQVMGTEAVEALYLPAPGPREAWPGQADEILLSLRRVAGKARHA